MQKKTCEGFRAMYNTLTIDPAPAKREETEERIEFTVNTFD